MLKQVQVHGFAALLLCFSCLAAFGGEGATSDSTGGGKDAPRDQLRLAMMTGIPGKWKLETNFEGFLRALDKASAAKADLFVTPECWLDGYAAADKESTVERLRGIAQSLENSTYLKRVGEEAKKRAMMMCFGFTSLEGNAIYNAAGLWDAQGKLIGVYHKTHLQKHDLQFSPGASLPCWPTPWGPMGIMICADRRWPETARVLRLEGARLILNPSYGMHDERNEWWMRTRSYENQCFIAFVHPNTAFVVNPAGELSGRYAKKAPGILTCSLDLSQARDDNHLQDRRPELYGIITQPKP